jgi:hypothetical protein
VAVKCFQLDNNSNPAKEFAKILKEYCCLKIASGLGVGPLLPRPERFDLIIYDNCIEFSMENCS